jgi:kynureninase
VPAPPLKERFHLPDGVVYLDGNSLGPLPKGAAERAQMVMAQEWGGALIRAWNDAGWMDAPLRVGDRIALLIGAPEGSVVVGETLSIRVFQALDAALQLRPGRRVILSDTGNFPSDLYMAQGLARLRDAELRVVAPEAVADAVTEDVAAVTLTHVDYRTGRMHDMAAVTRAAQASGAVMIWDLAHSVGATPLAVAASGAEFAVGCTYKYLNAGPGAPAFLYARADIADAVSPSLPGWFGHAAPFAMEPAYRPAPGVPRFRIGTPPVIQMAVLDAALDIWEDVSLDDIRAASIDLSERFIAGVEARCPQLALASPRDPALRGSHVSFAFAEGYAAMQALIARGVIGDFRAPDLMRFGFAPLYLDADDIDRAVDTLAEVMATEAWRDPAFQRRAAVT